MKFLVWTLRNIKQGWDLFIISSTERLGGDCSVNHMYTIYRLSKKCRSFWPCFGLKL